MFVQKYQKPNIPGIAFTLIKTLENNNSTNTKFPLLYSLVYKKVYLHYLSCVTLSAYDLLLQAQTIVSGGRDVEFNTERLIKPSSVNQWIKFNFTADKFFTNITSPNPTFLFSFNMRHFLTKYHHIMVIFSTYLFLFWKLPTIFIITCHVIIITVFLFLFRSSINYYKHIIQNFRALNSVGRDNT